MDSLHFSLTCLTLSKEEGRLCRPEVFSINANEPRLLTITVWSLVSWPIRADSLKSALTRAWHDEFVFMIRPAGIGTYSNVFLIEF